MANNIVHIQYHWTTDNESTGLVWKNWVQCGLGIGGLATYFDRIYSSIRRCHGWFDYQLSQ